METTTTNGGEMTRTAEDFARKLRNLEGMYARMGNLTGRNSDASDGYREMRFNELATMAHTDEVCDALDADEKLARRWNRMERRHAGLPA
jgi:hypothetical protein